MTTPVLPPAVRRRAALAGLDADQTAAVTAPPGPVCILAGPGSGKTLTVTRRIAYRVADGTLAGPEVLALTFTARAAAVMRTRLGALGAGEVTVSTFHAAARSQLGRFWGEAVGGRVPELAPSSSDVLAAVLPAGVDATTVQREIDWAKSNNVLPDHYRRRALAAGRQVEDPVLVGDLYRAYTDRLRQLGVIDFADVLLLAAAMFIAHPDIAARWRREFTALVVDEYQDVSPIQQQLIDLWLGGSRDLCVVGDPAQTIYSFAGATSGPLLDFADRYSGAEVVRLRTNYRSAATVVEVGNAILGAAEGPERHGAVQVAATPAGDGRWSAAPVARSRTAASATPGTGGTPAAGEAVAAAPDPAPRQPVSSRPRPRPRPGDPAPSRWGVAGLRLVEFATAMEEQAGLGQRIRTLAEAGALPSSIAVLARTNAHLQVWGRALTVAGIPTTLGTPNYHEVREVRMATAVLRAGALQGEAVDATLIGRPTMDQVRLLLGHVGWRPDRAAGSLGPDAWTAVAALHELARAMVAADPDVTLLAITDRIRAMAAAGEDPPLPAVTLMTLHAAKGMEWDHILLPGLRDGVLPATQATTPALREEERRLLYVGATRARATLWMSWALREGARGPRHQRTPFLDPVVDRWGFQPAAAVDRVPLRGGQRQSGLRRPGGPVRGRDGRFGMDDRRGTV